MAIDVAIPEMGESVSEVVLLRWIKSEGEFVERDEPICELETDKANVEMPSPAAGVLHLLREVDETLEVGDTIATIDETASVPAATESAAPESAPAAAPAASSGDGQPAPAAAPPPPPPSPAPVPAAASTSLDDLSPAVRRLVEENEVDLAALQGTGRGRRIIKQDVLAFLKEREQASPAAAAPQAAPAPPPQAAPPPPPAVVPAPQASPSQEGGTRRVPMSRIRRRIAQRLVEAQQTAALLTTFNEVDLHEVMALRARHKEAFQERHGVSLGLMSFFSRATVLSLMDFPDVNASIDGEDIVYHDFVNLGIAVSSERGLMVPVLRRADLMSMAQTESEIKRLAGAARDNKLKLDELSGGTFTITNGGVFGSLLSTPILTPPQSGILGMHAIKQRPVAVGGSVEVRPVMYLALSYDHRIVDGEQSVKFLVRIKDLLEDPARIMLEV